MIPKPTADIVTVCVKWCVYGVFQWGELYSCSEILTNI